MISIFGVWRSTRYHEEIAKRLTTCRVFKCAIICNCSGSACVIFSGHCFLTEVETKCAAIGNFLSCALNHQLEAVQLKQNVNILRIVLVLRPAVVKLFIFNVTSFLIPRNLIFFVAVFCNFEHKP